MSDFDQWFAANTGQQPYAWQSVLAASEACGDRLIRIPTGFGKTLGVLTTWAYHRLVRADDSWPRRLVWTLPMRVLVEQTQDEARRLFTELGLLWDGGEREDRVDVHVLMGGADAGDWHLWPEQPAVLIGTQDMLLSRALNRGYGAARARWPTDFGLLSQDVLWVLDEVQLMDVGLATAAQLGAFRRDDASTALRPAQTWAMSATLQRKWVTKSPDTPAWANGLVDHALAEPDRQADLWNGTSKPLHRLAAMTPAALATEVLSRHATLECATPLTLVVHNTVDRATGTYQALCKATGSDAQAPSVHLLHSRFRGVERDAWRRTLLAADAPQRSRIIVATQVIEAGVDLSADLLVTEISPWPSLVQRLGRLARRGGCGAALVIDVDRKTRAAPYEAEQLNAAWDALSQIDDGSPRALEAFERANPEQLDDLYPYDPQHLLLRQELDELFDTTPDLSGADLDVSRFIRSGDERDVSVFWVDAPREGGTVTNPDSSLRPARAGLVTVPFLRAADWLCGKGTKTSRPRPLRKGVHAWVWEYLPGEWRRLERGDLWPGQTVLVDAQVGGYSTETGWDPAQSGAFPLVEPLQAGAQERTDACQDHEALSASAWQTVGYHGAQVAREVLQIAAPLVGQSPVTSLLELAGRWHDLGKTHPAFQGAIVGPDRLPRRDLAKAPRHAWRHWRTMYQLEDGSLRPGFRHELASTLALFAVLERHAPPEHPSRLGDLAELLSDASPPSASSPPVGLEREILELAAEDFDLLAYLVCCHHGKLRARLHAAPADQNALAATGAMPIRGVQDGDELPATVLHDRSGAPCELPASTLSLAPAELGLSPLTGRSWTDRVTGLLARHGPFSLAYLEALLRAADVRASRDPTLLDPSLVAEQTS